MRRVLIGLIRLYQYGFSPVLPARCIHVPSCSQYAVEAISRHGPIRGLWFALCRLGRCHPFSKGGYDPVPEHHEGRQQAGTESVVRPWKGVR